MLRHNAAFLCRICCCRYLGRIQAKCGETVTESWSIMQSVHPVKSASPYAYHAWTRMSLATLKTNSAVQIDKDADSVIGLWQLEHNTTLLSRPCQVMTYRGTLRFGFSTLPTETCTKAQRFVYCTHMDPTCWWIWSHEFRRRAIGRDCC